MTTERESMCVLEECIELQRRKAEDYQNENSAVKQADHYRRGIDTIFDMVWQKVLRARSLIESGKPAVNEPLEDTFKDMINYASFAVAWLRGGIPGQKTVDAEKWANYAALPTLVFSDNMATYGPYPDSASEK